MKILLIITLLLFSCRTPEKYQVTGIIKEINDSKRTLLIDHNEIPGFMVPMVMYFNLHESVNSSFLSIDDSVSFDLVITNKNNYTLNYTILGKKSNINDFWSEEESDNKYSLKEPSEIIEDVTLLNINNEEVNLSEFNSDFVVISFIFSRCPMPNMCPAAIVKNQYLAEYFSNENINFFLISFDYLYDTPKILKKNYGLLESKNLKIFSSYNHVDDILILTKQLGLSFWGIEENNIGHTMRTVVLDKRLRLLTTFDGINWKAGDAKNTIEKLINFNK